jgi:hypothetical protein
MPLASDLFRLLRAQRGVERDDRGRDFLPRVKVALPQLKLLACGEGGFR